MMGFRLTLRCWCARPRAHRLPLPDADSLLLASGSEKIGQNSPGRFSHSDRRWRSIFRFDRLTGVSNPSEDLFGLSESFVSRGNSEVLIHISLGQIVRRDQIKPIMAAGEGGGVLGLCRPPSALSFDHERSWLRSHAQGKVPRFGDGDDL
jgi:hypothetical protein